MTKTVELLFEKNKIFLPVAADIDIMHEDNNGFVISVFTVDPTWQDFTGFPHYIAFVYDEQKEPQVGFMANEYSKIVEFWHEKFDLDNEDWWFSP